MKVTELIQRLQYILEEYATEDIDVTFSVGKKIYNLEFVDFSVHATKHVTPEQTTPDWQSINLRGTERK